MKDYNFLGEKQKKRRLSDFKDKYDDNLKDFVNEKFGLNACLIGVTDESCQTVVKFLNEDLLKEILTKIKKDEKEKAEEDKEVVNKKKKTETKENKIFTDWDFLYLKDMCKLSHLSFKLLCSILNLETNLNRMKTLTKNIHECFKTKKNEKGFYYRPSEKISFVLKRFIDENKILPSQFINIKLAGDSTVLNKPTVKILNYTFTIINDKKYNKTSKGHYLLGSFIIKNENYSELKEALSELFAELYEMQRKKVIRIDNNDYYFTFFGGGDMAFNLAVYGLNAANSNCSCCYCSLHKSEFSNLDRDLNYKEFKY
jgi:hypothetical protein